MLKTTKLVKDAVDKLHFVRYHVFENDVVHRLFEILVIFFAKHFAISDIAGTDDAVKKGDPHGHHPTDCRAM